jgi:hypothetical protein
MTSWGKSIRKSSRQPTRSRRAVVTTPPDKVLHRRIYFLNSKRSCFISFGFYPDKNYEPYVEVGGAKCGVVLSPYFFTTLVNHLPKLVENFINKEQYRCVEETFRLRLIGGKRVILQCDGLCIYLGINDVNFLLCNSNVLQHQLARYIFATPDVRLYVSKSVDSKVFVPPGEGVSEYVLYDVLCDELNSSLVSLPKL